MRYRDPQMLLATDQKLDTIQSTGTNINNAIHFTGSGTLRGHSFTNTGALLSPNSTITLGKTQLELHALTGATHLDVAGTLPAATQIDGLGSQHRRARPQRAAAVRSARRRDPGYPRLSL